MSFFKNVIVYRIGPDWTAPEVSVLEPALQRLAFEPCGPSQEVSVGWVPPRGEDHGALCELVDGQMIFKLCVERKPVPASAIKAELDLRCKALEAERGRKPGKKEKQEIKDNIVLEMLPRAFSKRSAHVVWIDVANRMMVIGAASHKAAEQVISQMGDLMAGLGHVLALTPINTEMSPAGAMASWLSLKEPPQFFTIDKDLALCNQDKAKVRYANHAVEIDEVVAHIEAGMLPTELALTWTDKVSFVLNDAMVLKKISYLDVKTDVGKDEGFDADVAIATGELALLLPDLLMALGGETDSAAAADAASGASTAQPADKVASPA